jgi:predicted nucleotidyltransferase
MHGLPYGLPVERIEEIAMLDLERVALRSLAEALEDHSQETTWWFDPRTGETEPYLDPVYADEDEDEDPLDKGLIPIEPIPSQEAYRDMEDFIGRVRDPRARDLLERAIAGRGAFRRFKDTLLDFQDLRQVWFAFHDARVERRAIEWLADQGLVERRVAERAARSREDPTFPELASGFDPVKIAEAVAGDLRALYGRRVRQFLLFGSWARGDAHPESDIDLLVVLDRVESPWEELRRMDEILWRHSYRNDVVISAVPVGEDELREPARPLLIRAQAEGRAVA